MRPPFLSNSMQEKQLVLSLTGFMNGKKIAHCLTLDMQPFSQKVFKKIAPELKQSTGLMSHCSCFFFFKVLLVKVKLRHKALHDAPDLKDSTFRYYLCLKERRDKGGYKQKA